MAFTYLKVKIREMPLFTSSGFSLGLAILVSVLVLAFKNLVLFTSKRTLTCWRRSIVVRTLVSAGELSLSCARLQAG